MIVAVAAAALMLPGAVRAGSDISAHEDAVISGTVPFCASWEVTNPGSTAFASVNSAAYDAGFFEVADLIKVTDFDCNSKYTITATKGEWTLPANYPSAGAKKADGSDADLLLAVNGITAGYATAGMAAQGTFASYTAVTTAGNVILGGGLTGEGVGHGVENAKADVDAKILMDWPNDIVGAYSITVTLTIAEAL